ncbi:hypothetical protein KKH23_02740 [Patescibacteria group bacterium]|nr:hypothetical protein [Patescibacteria group bacterium]MBU0777333.1 hypothetical protein [Patescibacteria group bacterium]MBU0846087.1 hypothetical protein [Patescibacteria group bacterium]MBU0923140.1 hypothetical protein [Patescibacteria group bacterium]MBU1066855.1 hypothetical protein [Patescibacteria group bacterium]
MKKLFVIALTLLLLLVAAVAVSAATPLPVCPESGGGWTRVNNGNWTEVTGATNYCFKFGNGAAPGAGPSCAPEPALYGSSYPGATPASRCPLNHWAYFVPPEPQCGPNEWSTEEGCIPKTDICHATGSWIHPFQLISPSNIGILMGHVGPGHQSGEDIIPPIPFYLPAGQNWNTVGQAIFNNGCELPEPHDYELVFDYRNECDGNNYYRIMLTDFGQYVTTLYHSGYFVWSEPFLLENKTFGPFDLGEFGTFPAVTLDEPLDCQVEHELAFVYTNKCVGWSYGYVLDGVETIIASGEWVDPYGEPEKIFVSFEVFLPAGEIANRSPIFGPWYLVEPADCQIFRTYKAHQAYLADSCEGIHRVINLYEGPASDPYDVLVGTLYNETVLFSDPFNLETIPAVTVDVPAAYGPDYTFAAMDEPSTCYSTCDLTTPVVQDPVWNPWSPWVYNPISGLEESFHTGTQTTLFMDSVDEGYVCGSSVEELFESRTREVDYSLTVVGSGDCFNWEYVPAFTKGGEMTVVGDLTGEWLDIYGPETAPVPTVTVVWPSGYALTVTPEAVVKDVGCIQCRITPYYPQASYHDAAAPGVYWQGPFGLGAGVCSVIHPEGQVPSAERVTTICSLCPDVFEGGYIYQVNHMFYDGWVYKVQCYGQEPHYTYMGYNWDAYVRIGEYTTEGERLSCRVQGCADWIHENMVE